MAQFQAYIHGSRGPTSRLGTKESGIYTVTRSWEGQVSVTLTYNRVEDCDMVSICAGPHGSSGGCVFYGKIADLAKGDKGLLELAARRALEKETANG